MKNQLLQINLPNNTKVFCLRKNEANALYEQVQEYFKFGIEINQEDTVFDVGANIGLFSLQINNICHQNANIYAFEPIPEIFFALQKNTKKANHSKIKVFPIGLGQKSQVVEFAYYSKATALSGMYPYDSPQEKNQFKTTTLKNLDRLPSFFRAIKFLPSPLRSFLVDKLLNIALSHQKANCQIKTISEVIKEENILQINLLKIDVEKAELDVLKGITTHDWSKIKQIIIEVHNIDDRLQKVVSLLKEKGFLQVIQKQENFLKYLDIHCVYAKR